MHPSVSEEIVFRRRQELLAQATAWNRRARARRRKNVAPAEVSLVRRTAAAAYRLFHSIPW